jgi:biopolymer transport protein TolR
MASVASRGRGGRGARRTISEINMVPFIDVMLVLLIIFMVTAPLITPSMIDLPSVGQAGRQPDKIIQIVIGKGERLEIQAAEQTEAVTMTALAARVKGLQTGGNTAVVISADKSVQYERVVKVMDTLQRAGVQRVGLSVQMAN